jgi:formylglycine-generating enzyme required for sulfatase activity
MKFLNVSAGEFVMGSPDDESGRELQEHQHRVRLSRSIWLGAFEVTQREWRRITGASPSWFDDGNNLRPVENVTWFEVQMLLDELGRRSNGNRFRLPTEAEWEFACRAGTTTAYATGAVLTHDAANYATSPEDATAGKGSTRAVGSYPPNAWGFHDMHGNVWEWTSDEYCPYPDGAVNDPRPACNAPLKVIRGGSFYFGADSARCGLRYTHNPSDRGFSLGFRVVREPR